ncbi:UPF0488 protein C8orf33 homolog [Chaetodon auriga]|uniref:UPF0488 protein C8orf33 homolog n=1 Tax=Chaetodon auriga TaxID=39042 RepID=UPI004032C212
MTEQRPLFVDKAPVHVRAEKPLRTHSDNTFRFNFFPDSPAVSQEETSPSSDRTEPAAGQISFTGQGSTFAFNFQIPPVPPVENMETMATPDSSSPGIQEEKPSPSQEVNSPPEPPVQSKTKKKKKSGKKKTDSSEPQQKLSSAEESHRDEDTELSAEEQLNRQLDWCIEQLELGMRSQKGTPKQKEEASRALKTLRSSKAPLAKKRQVMRAMTGDYRKKMEEEKSKQYKLIQSETTSVQVKSHSPKKSVFHRRADVRSQTGATEENPQQPKTPDTDLKAQTQEETPAFVFTPSKEQFHFNFL